MGFALLDQSPLPCFVNGEAWKGSASYEVKDPHNTSKVLHTVSSITVDDVPKVVETAAKAAKSWKNVRWLVLRVGLFQSGELTWSVDEQSSVLERRKIFEKAAALLRAKRAEFAQVEFHETTSSEGWAGFEASLAADSIEEVAAVATAALRGEIATTDAHQRAYIERCPFGVVLGMAPWNAPLMLGQRACLQPIMAGNSEISPRTHMIIAEIMKEAGLPDGVLTIIHVSPQDAPKVVEALIAAPAILKINFTGSTRVGSIVAQTAGRYLKPVVLELGGKAPAIVCADADLEHAANAIKFGAWFHSGQICMASQSAIVHESVADKFLEIFGAKVPRASGNPDDKEAALRGLFTHASAQRVKEIVDDALSKGAKVVVGEENKIEGNVVQPMLLKGVTEEMRIYREEMFAPVFSILTFKTEEQAIHYANDHDSIYSADTANAYKLARQVDSGMVHINGSSVHDSASMPHGGWKSSGYGRFNGIEGIREFTQTKVITINDKHAYPAPV
ncbi:SPOSA6832_03370 [Sporobolomyces salmonicolor]|uniref:SPOSA6832_03370-mRNA-1:cds n=1 Tax=Sporidiobolus salmonicolor TaxID=5005 RepID=A0A0D6EPA5_SPOSA|nr:SPOSA6832_03370 [Sporobolomyces salmonicolor]